MEIMLMFTAAIIYVSSFAIISFWMWKLYSKVTSGADENTVPYKARRLAKTMPLIGVCLTFVWSFLIGTEISREILKFMAFLSIGILLFQLTLVLMTLFSVHCRENAKKTIEGRLVAVLISTIVLITPYLAKASLWFVRLAASTKSSHDIPPEPYGYHGYESYEEKHRRIHGGRRY